jgi:integrase
MAGTVQHAKLESRTSRARLKRGRQPHWQALVSGSTHLGYQVKQGEPEGRWVLRRYAGDRKYRITGLGRADDAADADGQHVLDFAQAEAKARAMVATPGGGRIERITVRRALKIYDDAKRAAGQPVSDPGKTVHILPPLGDSVVAELTVEILRDWLAALASSPAQLRPKAGKIQFRPPPQGEEAIRRRRATANRIVGLLKAVLNFAYDAGHVANRDPWGRKFKKFKGVSRARVRYLSIPEAQRLMNACDEDFKPMVRAALETGARYSELCRLEVADFNPDSGTVHVRKSKSYQERHIVLTDDGQSFFRQHCVGRAGDELIFSNVDRVARALEKERGQLRKTGEDPVKANVDDRGEWRVAEQARPMRAANKRANLKPHCNFHALRHTWASLSVMRGVPLIVVAKNLGHRDTRMVETHYGHLSNDYISDAIRAGAPRYGIRAPDQVVVPLR